MPLRSTLDSIRSIVQALRVSSRKTEMSHGLSSAQLFVLRQLGESDVLSVNELAEKTFTHQSSVSVVVRKLVDLGLVEKRASKTDFRRTEISLTAKGRARVRRTPLPAQEQLLSAI